mmetsp:Transcript_15245/g.22365  ORF Transcript_15245/g.22365 Transcript_15245/m.22365 type:complete len:129 (-) Transcript_15245:639-1025(-)
MRRWRCINRTGGEWRVPVAVLWTERERDIVEGCNGTSEVYKSPNKITESIFHWLTYISLQRCMFLPSFAKQQHHLNWLLAKNRGVCVRTVLLSSSSGMARPQLFQHWTRSSRDVGTAGTSGYQKVEVV